GELPFENFMDLSDWIYAKTDATHRIALDRLANLVSKWLQEERGMSVAQVLAIVSSDYAGDAKHKQGAEKALAAKLAEASNASKTAAAKATPQRQSRHLAA
ncbi:MAG: B12-binding domain-containing radical SAM protein, partial [Burkholderiales bacterium]|nr:B12-binding domain-containing radical SAM protein [Burkholderiales bacterium]